MSIFKETRTPYEFLIRWDNQGNISGAHVGWLDTVLKDGVILTQTPANIESVAIAEQSGFPLEDVLSLALIDALKEIERLNLIMGEYEQDKSEYEAYKNETK